MSIEAPGQGLDPMIGIGNAEHKLEDALIQRSALAYIDFFQKSSKGPQLEGLLFQDDVEKALRHPDTVTVKYTEGSMEYLFPVITPIEFSSEYRQEYFENRWQGRKVFLFSTMPDEVLRTVSSGEVDLALPGKLADCFAERPMIIFDHLLEDEEPEAQLDKLTALVEGVTLNEESFVEPESNTQAAVHHFTSDIKRVRKYDADVFDFGEAYRRGLEEGVFDRFLAAGVYYVTGEGVTDELMDQMWHVYDGAFDGLVEHHPSAQKQLRKDLEDFLRSPYCNTVYALHEGRVASFATAVDGIDHCVWLNQNFMKAKFEGEDAIFLPAIATDTSIKGERFSPMIIAFIAELTSRNNRIKRVFTQCTNVSARYIPRMIRRFSRESGDLDFQNIGTYRYRAFSVGEA